MRQNSTAQARGPYPSRTNEKRPARGPPNVPIWVINRSTRHEDFWSASRKADLRRARPAPWPRREYRPTPPPGPCVVKGLQEPRGSDALRHRRRAKAGRQDDPTEVLVMGECGEAKTAWIVEGEERPVARALRIGASACDKAGHSRRTRIHRRPTSVTGATFGLRWGC
jgi:hypothetical protein